MYLILSEPDRARLGAPERLLVDLDTITNREAIQIRTMGYRTPRLFRRALVSVPLDVDGNEVTGDGPVHSFENDYTALTVLMWLALKRAGIDTDVRSLEFDVESLSTALDETEVEPETAPKDDPPDPEASET